MKGRSSTERAEAEEGRDRQGSAIATPRVGVIQPVGEPLEHPFPKPEDEPEEDGDADKGQRSRPPTGRPQPLPGRQPNRVARLIPSSAAAFAS